jgi:hypothetical protein
MTRIIAITLVALSITFWSAFCFAAGDFMRGDR